MMEKAGETSTDRAQAALESGLKLLAGACAVGAIVTGTSVLNHPDPGWLRNTLKACAGCYFTGFVLTSLSIFSFYMVIIGHFDDLLEAISLRRDKFKTRDIPEAPNHAEWPLNLAMFGLVSFGVGMMFSLVLVFAG